MDRQQTLTQFPQFNPMLAISIVLNIILIVVLLISFGNNRDNNHSMNEAEKNQHESSMHMDHDDYNIPRDAVNIPTIELKVVPDAKSGYNINVITTNFEFSPENVNNGADSYNEGHAHVYVNGVKIMRLYSDWFNLPATELAKDLNTLSVELNTNNHKVLHNGDKTVGAQVELIPDATTIDRYNVTLNEWRYIQSARPEVLLIDVRTPAEFAEGHLPGAVNISVESPDFGTKIAQLDKNQEYLVYCRTGSRSTIAFGQMEQLGYTRTFNAEDGFPTWKAAGYPTV